MTKRNHSKIKTTDDNDNDCKILKSGELDEEIVINETNGDTATIAATDRYIDIDTSYANWKDIPKNKRTYIIHKPVGALSSTIDSCPDRSGIKKPTVYETASLAKFPTSNYGLVGRLDVETSGIMMFTCDSELASAVRNPLEQKDIKILDENTREIYEQFKTKVYNLLILTTQKALHKDELNISLLEEKLCEPFNFQLKTNTIHTKQSDCKIIDCYRDESVSRGRPDLGWNIDVVVKLREGKHHQIRRIVSRCTQYVKPYKLYTRKLHRTSICGGLLDCNSIPIPGEGRWLTDEEINKLDEYVQIIRKSRKIPIKNIIDINED